MDAVVGLRALVAIGLSIAAFGLSVPLPILARGVLAAVGVALAITGFVASSRIERARGRPSFAREIDRLERRRARR